VLIFSGIKVKLSTSSQEERMRTLPSLFGSHTFLQMDSSGKLAYHHISHAYANTKLIASDVASSTLLQERKVVRWWMHRAGSLPTTWGLVRLCLCLLQWSHQPHKLSNMLSVVLELLRSTGRISPPPKVHLWLYHPHVSH
jgi:hypothetical protein